MKIKQLSLALPDGREPISTLAAALASHGINILTLSYAENCGGNGSRLQLLVNDPDKARELLTGEGMTVSVEAVVVVEIPDKPGGLARLMQIIRDHDLAFSALQVFSHRTGAQALVDIAFSEPDRAARQLARAGIKVLSTEELLAR